MEPLTEAHGELADGYDAPTCEVRGGARSARFQPEGFSLWSVLAELEAGTELTWGSDHGDEAIYVIAGQLEADGRKAPTSAAIILEAGVPGVVRATEGTQLAHFGPTDATPPSGGLWGPAGTAGRGVHVIPVEHADEILSGGTQAEYYRDGTYPTCRLSLFTVEGDGDGSPGASHFHSEDEIILVTEGSLQIAGHQVPAGASIAIPDGWRYAIRKSGRHKYVNYRRDVSTYTSGTSSDPIEMIETVEGLRAAAAARVK